VIPVKDIFSSIVNEKSSCSTVKFSASSAIN
jgi:hypothetical protein